MTLGRCHAGALPQPKPPSPPSSKRATRVNQGLQLVQEESEPPTAEASRARLSAVAKPEPSKAKAKRGFMGGIMRGMGHAIASATGQAPRTHGQQLLPASSSEMSGWLYKQGTNSLKNSAWQKRERQAAAARARSGCALWPSDPLALLPSLPPFLSLLPPSFSLCTRHRSHSFLATAGYFLLHGAFVSYYETYEAAQAADESHCRGCGTVCEAERWPLSASAKPSQVPESVFSTHKHAGFRIATEDKEFWVYADSEMEAKKWVNHLAGAAKLSAKVGAAGGHMALPSLREGEEGGGMPGQPELDKLLNEMMDAQGFKEVAREQIKLLPDTHKWQLLQNYQQQQKAAVGDIREQPEHWINVLNIDPTIESLQSLSVLIRQKPVIWVCEFLELHGIESLCELLEILEKNPYKKPHEFELMDQVLRCLKSLMNLEQGMNAMLGIEVSRASAIVARVDCRATRRRLRRQGARRREEGVSRSRARGQLADHAAGQEAALVGLRQLALCADGRSDALEARKVQCTALTLLSAAALFSDEGHRQVLSALDDLKRTRRRLHRFGWLVEACNRMQKVDAGGVALAKGDADAEGAGKGRRSSMSLPQPGADGAPGEEEEAGGSLLDISSHVIECILMLINAVVGFPEDLRERVKLRAELIRLQLLDILAALHKERHIEVVRQVEIFEGEMIEDNEEVAKMGEEGEEGTAGGGGKDGGAGGMVLDGAVGSPLQLLQDRVLNATTSAILPKFLSVLRALSALPDSEMGLVAWSHLEKLAESTIDAVAKNDDVEKLRAALTASLGGGGGGGGGGAAAAPPGPPAPPAPGGPRAAADLGAAAAAGCWGSGAAADCGAATTAGCGPPRAAADLGAAAAAGCWLRRRRRLWRRHHRRVRAASRRRRSRRRRRCRVLAA